MPMTMFGGDDDGQSNACVGNNGWVDLSTYSQGFDEAVKILLAAALKHQGAIDALIYPIVFNARHRIELFIKSEIRNISSIRSSLRVSEEEIIKTHDLMTLWDILEELYSKCDRRYSPLSALCGPYIVEFHGVDPKGETFRYPYSQDGIKHLTNRSVIGINRFAKTYSVLTEKLREIQYLSEFLRIEYGSGTYTENLSRRDLEDIATELPDRATWGSEDGQFDIVREIHLKRYRISRRSYCKALNIIQQHREFAAKIGMDKPIPWCNASNLQALLVLRNSLNKFSNSFESGVDQERTEARKNYQEFLNSKLSDEELATIVTLFELGNYDSYSEEFDFVYNQNIERIKSFKPSAVSHFSSKAYLAQPLEKSLKKLGQRAILADLGDIGMFKYRQSDVPDDLDSESLQLY